MYHAKDFSSLLTALKGFSEQQLAQHFELYAGYVDALNHITEQLSNPNLDKTQYAYGEYTELKRRYAVAYNGMALHELYFNNLTENSTSPEEALLTLLEQRWGSQDQWEADLKATGTAGPGWVITAFNSQDQIIENLLITEHHVGWPVRFEPIIVLDMWEHAFAVDFGIDKASYMDRFLEHLDWDVANQRLTTLIKHDNRHTKKVA